MRLLVLGGTAFLGRAFAACALARGHELTLFHRGRTNRDLFPEAEHVLGDRDGDLGRLSGRRFDAVVDTSGYVPRVVAASVALARRSAERYLFVSTLSVYADVSRPGVSEDAPLATLADESVEEVDDETYGALKALCEQAVRDGFGAAALVVRPGLIVGPHDPSDRFTYWPLRVACGGEVLVPGRPDRRIQLIDVRDLAAWMLALAEEGTGGVMNAVGPAEPLTMGQLVESCRRVSGAAATPVWLDEELLLDHGVEPWSDLPLWLPERDRTYAGFFAFDASSAIERGLQFRPLDETVADTLAWARTRPPGPLRAGLTRARERELLDLAR